MKKINIPLIAWEAAVIFFIISVIFCAKFAATFYLQYLVKSLIPLVVGVILILTAGKDMKFEEFYKKIISPLFYLICKRNGINKSEKFHSKPEKVREIVDKHFNSYKELSEQELFEKFTDGRSVAEKNLIFRIVNEFVKKRR